MAPPTPVFDALTLFTLVWVGIVFLQFVKMANSNARFSDVGNVVSVAAWLLAVVAPWRSMATVGLCASHIYLLWVHGSQSNHVVVATAVAAAVLLNVSADRRTWTTNCAGTLFVLLVLLYAIPLLHKLNTDWFDPEVSCASLFASGFLSLLLPIPEPGAPRSAVADVVIRTAPYQAVVIESVLPTLLLLWRHTRAAHPRASLLIFRVLLVGAAGFHLSLCLPLPPMSVYPFSMVMVPFYVFLLPPDAVARIGNVFGVPPQPLPTTQPPAVYPHHFAVAVAAVAGGARWALTAVLRGEEMPLEYPPYGLWLPAAVWNIVVWGVLVVAAFAVNPDVAPSSKAKATDALFPAFSYRRPACVAAAAAVAVVGLGPYLGLRNYPALAMFSNLRAEGGSIANNHLLVPAWTGRLTGLPHDTVTVVDTDLPALRNYQVNLACYFTRHTKRFNEAYGVRNEFWIAPPAWKDPAGAGRARSGGPAEVLARVAAGVAAAAGYRGGGHSERGFQSYSVPLVELRKVLSDEYRRYTDAHKDNKAGAKYSPFFVSFRRNRDSRVVTIDTRTFATLAAAAAAAEREGEKEGSARGTDWALFRSLTAPVPWWLRAMVRFRSFDFTDSPCRH